LKALKEGHQKHLLNTKYLRSHIMLVSKEDLEGIKEEHREYLQKTKGNLSLLGLNGLIG